MLHRHQCNIHRNLSLSWQCHITSTLTPAKCVCLPKNTPSVHRITNTSCWQHAITVITVSLPWNQSSEWHSCAIDMKSAHHLSDSHVASKEPVTASNHPQYGSQRSTAKVNWAGVGGRCRLWGRCKANEWQIMGAPPLPSTRHSNRHHPQSLELLQKHTNTCMGIQARMP